MHSFVVPAYGQSTHLADCLRSLTAQTIPSEIIVVTSTPFAGLEALARRHGARLIVHGPNQGIAHDWNMALGQGYGEWITIAHQDDLYHSTFCERTLEALANCDDALLAFTGYEELTNTGIRGDSMLLRIKRMLLEFGFLGRSRVHTRLAKTNCLRFGCPVPCPSVTLRRSARVRFDARYGVNLDWAAWLDLCARPGSFVWVRESLMAHRIHFESETTQAIAGGRRMEEDERLLRRLWPGWLARMIVYSYRLAYASNES